MTLALFIAAGDLFACLAIVAGWRLIKPVLRWDEPHEPPG